MRTELWRIFRGLESQVESVRSVLKDSSRYWRTLSSYTGRLGLGKHRVAGPLQCFASHRLPLEILIGYLVLSSVHLESCFCLPPLPLLSSLFSHSLSVSSASFLFCSEPLPCDSHSAVSEMRMCLLFPCKNTKWPSTDFGIKLKVFPVTQLLLVSVHLNSNMFLLSDA